MDERRLAWSDRQTDYLVNALTEDTDGDSINNELALPLSERQFLVLEVTGEEYTKVFSSVMLGSDLMFNDTAHQVTWLVWKAAKMATLCEAIASCITNSESVQEAINQVLADTLQNGGVGSPGGPVSGSVLTQGMMPDIGCSNDELWGGCEEVIDGIFEATLEFLQRAKVSANAAEGIGNVLDSIPIIGSVLAGAFTTYEWVVDSAHDLFVAADSDVVREELACDLFCFAQQNCDITMEDVLSVFNASSEGGVPPDGDFAEVLAWVVGMTLGGEADKVIAASIAQIGVQALRYGGKLGQNLLGVRSLDQYAQLGALDNPNSQWTILCTDCGWLITKDFTVDDGGFEIVPGINLEFAGEYINGVGWRSKQPNTGKIVTGVSFGRQFSIATTLEHVTIVYDLDNSGEWPGAFNNTMTLATQGVNTRVALKVENAVTASSGTNKTMVFDGSRVTWTTDFIKLIISSGVEMNVENGSVIIKSIEMRGSGERPDWGTNT